jgi:hypothetical protein
MLTYTKLFVIQYIPEQNHLYCILYLKLCIYYKVLSFPVPIYIEINLYTKQFQTLYSRLQLTIKTYIQKKLF